MGTKNRPAVTLASAYLSDRYRQRALSVVVPACIALIGFAVFLGASLWFKCLGLALNVELSYF